MYLMDLYVHMYLKGSTSCLSICTCVRGYKQIEQKELFEILNKCELSAEVES